MIDENDFKVCQMAQRIPGLGVKRFYKDISRTDDYPIYINPINLRVSQDQFRPSMHDHLACNQYSQSEENNTQKFTSNTDMISDQHDNKSEACS